MKCKIYHIVGPVLKSNRNIIERGKIETPNTQINVREYRRGNQNGQSRETGKIGYTRPRKNQHNMCWTPLFTSRHT